MQEVNQYVVYSYKMFSRQKDKEVEIVIKVQYKVTDDNDSNVLTDGKKLADHNPHHLRTDGKY